jgi:hypothetical protein
MIEIAFIVAMAGFGIGILFERERRKMIEREKGKR